MSDDTNANTTPKSPYTHPNTDTDATTTGPKVAGDGTP